MPTKIVNDLITKIESLEKQLIAHLVEGTGVKTDIKWLKWLTMGIALKLISDLFLK